MRSIVTGTLATCSELDCAVLAEGVETIGEYRVLRDLGIDLFQGYPFARPALEALPEVVPAIWDSLDVDLQPA